MRMVKDLALRPIESVDPRTVAIEALRMMEAKMIHSLAVFDGERFAGLVTMTDIATKAFTKDLELVGAIMTPAEKVISVGLEDDPLTCANLMKANNIHHLVVEDSGGRVIHVLSSIDLMIAEADKWEEIGQAATEGRRID